MKKIYFTLILLLSAMIGMTYVYFSNLNRQNVYQEISLYAATANSGLIFGLQNDKSVFDILKGQDLFQQLLGLHKFNQLSLLKNKLAVNNSIHKLIANTNIYISFSPGENREIDYLISTRLNNEQERPMLIEALKSNGIQLSAADKGVMKLILNDSTAFYLGLEKNLILLSNASAPVKSAMTAAPLKETQEFIAYIRSYNKHSKNSLGSLFIDFNRVPPLLKSILPGSLSGNLDIFSHQDAFATLDYNFSKERLFFNGNLRINEEKNYLKLFAGQSPQKNTIDNLLPENTANFRLFSIPDYNTWHKSLNNWFLLRKEAAKVKKIIAETNKEYHLDADEIFPKYFKNQLILFQLKSAENIAAINLSNGDKVKQLLLDISTDYNEDIKVLKKPGLLYCYFGEPFRKFSKPYYTIIDNYMVCANRAGALQSFINTYRSNKLLVSTPDYINLYSQISNSAGITFYINHENSVNLVRNTVYRPYYNHFMAKDGLKKFSSFIYQLSGDQGTFQTTLIVNTFPENVVTTLQNGVAALPENADQDLTNK